MICCKTYEQFPFFLHLAKFFIFAPIQHFEQLDAFHDAVEAQRRLAQIDAELADAAIEVALRDQEERQQLKSDGEAVSLR